MNFLDKVKNFFYEEEDEVVEQKTVPKKSEKKHIEINKEEKIERKRNEKNNLTERELFDVERTFNFPMDLDENIFDKEEQKKEEPQKNQYGSSYSLNSFRKKEKTEVYRPEPKKEVKKFKPTPVISPVYGVLNKDYQINDVENLSKTKEFNLDKKIVDFDSVRNKAYKELDDEIEKTFTKNRDIFYNLEEDDEIKEEVKVDDENIKIDEDTHVFDDVVISYNVEEEKEEEIKPKKEEKITRSKKNKDVAKIEEDYDEDEEEDLFSLIDNMYKSEDEEDE